MTTRQNRALTVRDKTSCGATTRRGAREPGGGHVPHRRELQQNQLQWPLLLLQSGLPENLSCRAKSPTLSPARRRATAPGGHTMARASVECSPVQASPFHFNAHGTRALHALANECSYWFAENKQHVHNALRCAVIAYDKEQRQRRRLSHVPNAVLIR
jgi:hypothetical protein